MTDPGDPEPRSAAPGADLRTDLPRYRVYEHGRLVEEPASIERWWRGDLTAFLIGCSFTFEQALIEAGIPLRHVEEGKNVAMYVTGVPCAPAGPFAGPLVVSMRPLARDRIADAFALCSGFQLAHAAPVASAARTGSGSATWGRRTSATRSRSATTRSPCSGPAASPQRSRPAPPDST